MSYINQQSFDNTVYDLHDKRLSDDLSGIIKSDGNGNILAAVRGVDYAEFPSQSGNSGKFLSTDGADVFWDTVNGVLPSQAGQSGKYLTTDGTSPSWSTVDSLPSQTGQSGKYLTTDGTDASWNSINFPVSSVNGKTGTVILSASDVGAPTKTSDLTNDSGFITANSPELLGTPTAPTPTVSSNQNQISTKGYVDSKIENIQEKVFFTIYGDTTYSDTLYEYNLGKLIVCKNSSFEVLLSRYNTATFYFYYFRNGSAGCYTLNSSGWSSNSSEYVATTTTVNNKPLSSNITLTASDVGALSDSIIIPTATSDLINDSGFVTTNELPQGSSSSPLMDGIASAGTGTSWSRGDHVHPSDTSRQAKITSSGILKGDGTGVVTAAVSGVDYQAPGNYMVKDIDYVTAGKASDIVLGEKATSEGSNTAATGIYSHAEGNNTVASAQGTHAEGSYSVASFTAAHAEGGYTTASGENSHAEGRHTLASGLNSHAEGTYTISKHKSQHVFGEYNIQDPNVSETNARGDYIEIVGNGTGNSLLERSNARTLDWYGNEVLAGKLTLGAAPTGSMDVTTKGYVDSSIQQHGFGVSTSTATLNTSSTSVQVQYSGIYVSTNIIDSYTKEEVGCKIIHSNGYITVSVERPPSNPLDITVVYLVVS